MDEDYERPFLRIGLDDVISPPKRKLLLFGTGVTCALMFFGYIQVVGSHNPDQGQNGTSYGDWNGMEGEVVAITAGSERGSLMNVGIATHGREDQDGDNTVMHVLTTVGSVPVETSIAESRAGKRAVVDWGLGC
ncbi:uncharacterized protein LY89DRAFT_778345 [Mollisia scopiformis]|uniref:Uncharacterized protein n=1 Tax=Mollisia scopiformis TaxID=149040 RepID=A0A194XQK6_MOLSC|nr:uncharacterized protein LY89DRAFT_778345 [Mollisia scopiformis]KUJ22002.1 hypothetical protein LY89DRAFT_778345 [Mollisia scopiformis]